MSPVVSSLGIPIKEDIQLGEPGFSVVTGAFGYTGKYIAQRLLDDGVTVRSLTRNPASFSPFGDRVERHPLDFDDPVQLIDSMRGADTLYNTFWIRFAHGIVSHETAVQNTRNLVDAAGLSGVRRIVHISITGASADSPLPYFSGKGQVEDYIMESGLPYSIIRPTVIFGPEDILLNNIAWFLRRFPVFPIAGNGDYPVQPVYVDDVARLAVDSASTETDVALDAVGPETYTFRELVDLLRKTIGGRTLLLRLPPPLVLASAALVGLALRDVVLTSEEIDGLMSGHLVSTQPPTGTTHLSNWLKDHRQTLGKNYASELARHYR